MKKMKYLYMLLIGAVITTSCSEEGDSLASQISNSPNTAGFALSVMPMSGVADGSTYDFDIRMLVAGPTSKDLSENVTVRLSVDTDQSTAIEGTHFEFESNELTITPNQNSAGVLPITLLTEGIVAPLAENPVLVLNVESVSGDRTVVGSGKALVVNLLYLCPGDLSGTYTVTNDWCAPTFTTTITANADGSWFIAAGDGGGLHQCTANTGLVNWANINEVCGVIQPTNNLRFGASNDIGNITGGSWDQDTGVLTMSHIQEFTGNWPGSWNSTYTRQ
ncbi:MAG: hypothetical protein JXR03_18580 [Cyclobacteriaceae bacterium]